MYVVRDEVGGEYLVRADSPEDAIDVYDTDRRAAGGDGKHWRAESAWKWSGTLAAIKWRH
jgi:hypothetical protein